MNSHAVVDPGNEGASRSGATPTLHCDPNVLAKRVGDEIVLVHLETNRIFELNRTAAALWDLLATTPTRAELEQQMGAEFDVEPEQLATEIDDLLRQLASEQLISIG
jgi:hypothetical protein